MRLSLVLLTIAGTYGCDILEGGLEGNLPPPPDLPPPPPPPDVDDVREEVEDALLEKLQCDETLRPSTLARMRAFLDDADLSTLQALLLNPQDLASVVALGGPQVEVPVIVARNLVRVVDDGSGAELLAGGWDAVLCGDAVPLSCTAGEEATTVSCDGDGKAQSISLSFDRCALGGTVYDGDLVLARPEGAGAEAKAAVSFSAFTLNEVRALEGALLLDVGAGVDGFAAGIASPDAFSLIDHGGLAGGLECGAELTFEALALSVGEGDDDATVEMNAFRAAPDVTVGVETFGDHLVYSSSCFCPQPGSGVFVDVPKPLGRAGETGRARISWQTSTDSALCSQPVVQLVAWPTDCSGLDNVDGDCAKGATEDTLTGLLESLCAL